jgi:uncharacterized membrane protein YhaH (DUF805 family)
MWNLWLILSIIFAIITIIMLILSLTVNTYIWIGFSFTLIATIIFVVMYFRSGSSGHLGGSESSLDGY